MSQMMKTWAVVLTAAAVAAPAVGQQLLNIRIDGPDQVAENTVSYYKVFAAFDNGQEYEVTLSAELAMEPGVYAAIGPFGDMTALEVGGNTSETVRAAFEYGGDRREAQKEVAILDRDSAGYALDFDGSDDLVLLPKTESLAISGSLTIETWVRIRNFSTGALVFNGDARAGLDPYWLHMENNRLRFRIHDDNNREASVSANRGNCNWAEFQHVAAVFDDDADEMRICINGSSVAQISTSVSPMKDQEGTMIMLGAVLGGPMKFDGEMEELRIWSVARTAEQIREAMQNVLCGTESGLVGYWRFNESEGQVVHDLSRYGNDGVLGQSNQPEGSDPLWVLSEAPLGPAVCEPVNCDAIRKFKVTCRGGTLQATVKSDLPPDTELTIDDNGAFAVMTINAKGKGKVRWTEQTGIHTVFVRECPDHLRAVNCGA